jgi:hypothetical protein
MLEVKEMETRGRAVVILLVVRWTPPSRVPREGGKLQRPEGEAVRGQMRRKRGEAQPEPVAPRRARGTAGNAPPSGRAEGVAVGKKI